MAAPTPTARVTPSAAKKLRNGSKCLITFASDTNIELFEKGMTLPGIDSGAPVQTGDFFNTTWRTKAAQRLKEMTEGGGTFNFDPKVYTALKALIGTETTITMTNPDLSSVAFYGYARNARFSEMTDGSQPTVTLAIEPTNTDPSDGTEADPVYTAPP